MFASSGVFRNISCPYYIYGLCTRPYCHFKHSKTEETKVRKKEEESQKTASQENDDSYTVPTSSLQKTLASIEESIKSEKQKLLKKEKVSTESATGSIVTKTQPTGTPKYSPTPLHELEKKKLKGKLGGSKYDLALLNGPSSSSEYDPASNYSTPCVSASSNVQDNGNVDLPCYVKSIQGQAENNEPEDDSELTDAKIPQFVSVDYTPTTFGEFSDEESHSEKQELSENESDKSAGSEKIANDEARPSLKKENERHLPIEFTADGFVKSPVSEDSKSVKSTSDHKKKPSTSCKVVSKDDNIFSLFQEEFDKDLESCTLDSGEKSDILGENRTSSKVKMKRSSAEFDKTQASEHSDHYSLNTPSTSAKHKDNRSIKHSSHHSAKHSSSKHSSSDISKTDKPHSHSKHSESSSKKASNLSRNGELTHKSEQQKEHSKHHESISKHSSKSSKNGEYIETKGETSKHSSKHHERNKEKHKHESKSMKSHSDKHGKLPSKHSSRKSSSDREKVTSPKKRKIVNLDIDLFGGDNDNEMIDYRKNSGEKNGTSLDLDSDLEKYFSDEDPFDECLRIFNEQPVPSTSSADKKKQKKSSDADKSSSGQGKKRIALKQTDEHESKKRKTELDKPKPKPSPAQVMMNRYKMMQQRALEAEEEAKKKIKAKVREASQQNKTKAATQSTTATVASAGAAFNSYMKSKKTTAVTVTKGKKRKAHTPTVAIEKLKRPVVEVTGSSRVGANIRQRYLNLFIDECLKLHSTDKEAFNRGKEEEEKVYKRSSNKKIYLNIAVITIKRLRNEVEEKKKKPTDTKPKGSALKLSHAKMLDGAHAKKTNYTVNRSGGAIKLQEEDFLGSELYKRLKTYILTEDQLRQNNYPRTDPLSGGTAVFYGEEVNKQKGSTKGYEKLCRRCGKVFEVYPNGKYPVKEECVYHWGKAWKKKIAGSLETRYTCCSGDLSSDGCQVAKAHVHETNKKENMTGYMKTIPCSPPIDGDYGTYAVDCEMVYTTMGVELARVTVVGGDAEPIYESLVRPDNPIVDFNTRFSGITEDDMEDVHTSLRDVQAVLLSLFTDKTILIGHSLESDLVALKLIHSTVVDTSMVFPHRMGLPYKRALRNLMSEYLQKIIQDDVGGHDSLEDAVACIELMQYQLKEDARRAARRQSS